MIPDWKKQAYLERLNKRMEFLGNRTKDRPDLTFDVAEYNALKWAIRSLRDIHNL